MIHTRESLALQAKVQGDAFVTVILGPTDKAWNPERNDTLLRGPARVTYVFWTEDEIDFAYHALEGA